MSGRTAAEAEAGLSVCMVGVGAFAQGFIPLFKAHPLVTRLALCDLVPDKLAENAERHGIEETLPSLDALCDADFDAAVIITQPWLHGPQAVQALRAGMHAWSAVPAGRSIDECRQLVAAVEDTGRIYMMAETSYYYPGVLYCRQRHAEGAFGHLVYAACEYYHDWDHGLYDVMKWRAGDDWRRQGGTPPMYYPTHSTSQLISVSGARMTHVSCMGFVDRNEDGIYDPQVNDYSNPFSNQTALFRMSDGSSCRVNEFRRIGHPGAVRMSLYGTEGSFEDSGARQRFLTKERGSDGEDVTAMLTSRGSAKTPASAVKSASSGSGSESMAAVTAADGTHLDAAPIHPVARLPAEFAGLKSGHAGSHHFLVDDFVRACVGRAHPPNHVWNAARYTVPGFVAHESALQGGALLEIPDLGDPPQGTALLPPD